MAPMALGRIDIKYRRVACQVPQNLNVIVDENRGAGGWIRLQVKVCATSESRTLRCRHHTGQCARHPPVATQIASSEGLLGRCQLTGTDSNIRYQQISQQEAPVRASCSYTPVAFTFTNEMSRSTCNVLYLRAPCQQKLPRVTLVTR